jgi:hypothetical protein
MRALGLIISVILVALPSQAYMSLMTTGDILQKNQVQGLGYLQFWRGTNIHARGSLGVSEDLQADLEVASGDFDFMVSAMAKWVPIPDYEKQPALGIRGGLTYIDTDRYTQTSIVATPFASKAFQSPHGKFAPFAGVPLALNTNSDDTFFTARLLLGLEWTPENQSNFHVIGEAGIKISSRSFGSLNIGAAYDF